MFVATIEDLPVVPYVRMTYRGKNFKKSARRYLKNQQDLAWMIRANGRGTVQFPCILFATIEQKTLRQNADLDNIIKALTDALVKAGVIPDDSLRYIVGYRVEIKKAETDSITLALVHSIAELIASEEVQRSGQFPVSQSVLLL